MKVESFCRFGLSVLHEVSVRCARKFFLVRRYESAIIVYFQVGSARNGGFFLIMFFIRSCCSRSRFMFRSCF